MKRVQAAVFSFFLFTSNLAAQEVNSFAKMTNDFGAAGLTGKKLKAAIDQAASRPLGSVDNPVRADGPPGQRAYLSRLRCADGLAPVFNREGNIGPGVFGYFVDKYVVTCGGQQHDVFMDMYHLHVEHMPVPGFSIDAIADKAKLSWAREPERGGQTNLGLNPLQQLLLGDLLAPDERGSDVDVLAG